MIFRLWHETRYKYASPVRYSHNQVHLRPRDTGAQRCLEFTLSVSPQPDDLTETPDVYGNSVAYFSLYEPHREFVVRSEARVEVVESVDQGGVLAGLTVAEVQQLMQQPQDEQTRMACEFLYPSPYVRFNPAMYNYAARALQADLPVQVAVTALMAQIFNEFEYDPSFTSNATPLDTVLAHKKGVCQDFAHLAIAGLRAHGLAARYVSGYLETDPPPGKEKLIGADASHAWFALYVPGAGWLDFDPTNNQVPMGRHITVSWGRDYADVTPLKGIVYGGGKHTLDVAVDVRNEPLVLKQQQLARERQVRDSASESKTDGEPGLSSSQSQSQHQG